MIKNLNELLLYIFIILLLYCLMYTYLYNSKPLIFDSDIYSNINTDTDKFIDITYEDEQDYLNSLENIKNGVNNSIVNNNYINNMKSQLSNLNAIINSQDYITVDNLSNIYMKDYVEYIHRKNAIVYNEYEKLRTNYYK
jgi:hypothetical protein